MGYPNNFGDLPAKYSEEGNSRIVVVPVPYDKTSTWLKGAVREFIAVPPDYFCLAQSISPHRRCVSIDNAEITVYDGYFVIETVYN